MKVAQDCSCAPPRLDTRSVSMSRFVGEESHKRAEARTEVSGQTDPRHPGTYGIKDDSHRFASPIDYLPRDLGSSRLTVG